MKKALDTITYETFDNDSGEDKETVTSKKNNKKQKKKTTTTTTKQPQQVRTNKQKYDKGQNEQKFIEQRTVLSVHHMHFFNLVHFFATTV